MKWTFRPSALLLSNFGTRPSKKGLVRSYHRDNERAMKDGVSVPPKPKAALRTLQWNIHAFVTADYDQSPEVAYGVISAILKADADVIVLNEYHWDGKDDRHHTLERRLKEKGYKCWVGRILCPTFLATRLHVRGTMEELRLSVERSALMVHADDPQTGQPIWVVGTHLDHIDGNQRRKEMEVLLQNLQTKEDGFMLLMGDFNQQRQHDYSLEEWDNIAAGMASRGACPNDGVAELVQNFGFACSLDFDLAQTNWDTPHPPSTHWTGTIVDYSYGKHMGALGVYVSPNGLSDHRCTVCDWQITKEARHL